MSDRNILEFLTTARRYLMQQQDLFGDVIYADGEMARNKRSKGDQISLEVSNESWTRSATLHELDEQINDCTKCPLGFSRTNFVFGTGNPTADVMFIGEAPGADEDTQGEPFVGRAGQLLNKIIEAVGMKREEVYICNIIKCRPPNNRAPLPMEIETCTPYLLKQIELVKPKFIISLGRTAAQWLLQTSANLGSLRGTIHDYRGIKLIVTYHPAALLRNPDWKRPTWDDMKMFRKAFDELTTPSPDARHIADTHS